MVIVTSCRIFGQQATHSKQTNEASHIGRRINPRSEGCRDHSEHTHTHTHTQMSRDTRVPAAARKDQRNSRQGDRAGAALPNVISLQLSDSISNIVIDDDIATRVMGRGGGEGRDL